MPKTKRIRQIDKEPRSKVGDLPESATVAVDFAPPSLPRPLAPTNLALTTATEFSSASPSARVTATWDPPPGVQPRSYVAQISESNTFPAAGTLTLYTRADQESVDFNGRRPGVTQYVRVAAVTQTQGAWTATASIVAATDTTPAAQPTASAATWFGYGHLRITFTPPTNDNYKDVQIQIFGSSGGTLYHTEYNRAGEYVYLAELNRQETGGAGDASLYIELRSRTFSNVINTSSVPTITTTKPVPATPTNVTHTWSAETDHNGVAGPDWTLSWDNNDDAYYYRIAIDAVNRSVGGRTSSYTYPLVQNTKEHSGTPDPVLSYSLVAVDAFGQASSAASGTATNEDPPTPTVSVTRGALAGLWATAGGTKAADFAAYEFVFKRDGTTVKTVETQGQVETYDMSATSDAGYHSWTTVVRQKDLFGQYSPTITSSAIDFEPFTLQGLRDLVEYSDSEGTSGATLKAALADGNTTSGGITYNP